jgi:DHA1 family tetracycline resistance protein-like MFS transporter
MAGEKTPVMHTPAWRSFIEPWFLSYALLGASVAGLAPILLPLSVGRSGSITEIGLVMGAFNLGGLSAPLWGTIADHRGGHRWILLTGLFVTGVTLAAFPFALSVGGKVLLALAQGSGAACAATVANLSIVQSHPRPEWDERIGWLQTFYGAGQVLGLLLAGMMSGLNLPSGFTTAGGLTLLACLPAVFLKEGPRQTSAPRPVLKHASRHAELIAGSPQSFYHHLNIGALRHLLRSLTSPLGIFLGAWFISFCGVAAFFSLYPVLMEHLYGVDPSVASIGFAVAATAGLFLYAPAGRWSKKQGPLRVFRAALVTRAFSFLVLLGLTALRLPWRGSSALIGFAFVVLAWSLLSVAGTEITAQFSQGHEGEGLGLFNASTAVAGVVGALVGGWSAGAWGYGVVPVLGLGGVLLGILMTARVR